MSFKTAIRHVISQNALAHRWFVGFCARYTVRLLAFQSYLSIEDLRAKRRAAMWRRFVALLGRPNVDRVVISDGKATFYYVDGCAFHASTARTSVSGTQFFQGEYEPQETRLIREVIKPGWTVVDAGANFGWHAVHFAKLAGPQGRVFAFEPVPSTFRELADNARLNELKNLEACSVALGSTEGTITLFLPGIDLGAGAASQYLDQGEKVEVPMRRLDNFLAEKGIEKIDFIKADIEGGELNLLQGAERLLTHWHPRILIEIVDIHLRRFGRTPQDVIQFLISRGFSGRYVSDDGTLAAFDPINPPNGNYFFEPSS